MTSNTLGIRKSGLQQFLWALIFVVGVASIAVWTWRAIGRPAIESNATGQSGKVASTPAPVAHPIPPQRPTFDTTTADLIDRYNTVAKGLDRSLLLPPLNAMEPGGKNAAFHTYRHVVAAGIVVVIEVDNTSNRPFSIGVFGNTDGTTTISMNLIAVLATIGRALVGDDGDGGILIAACNEASKAAQANASRKYKGLEASCGVAGPIWIASVSAPKP